MNNNTQNHQQPTPKGNTPRTAEHSMEWVLAKIDAIIHDNEYIMGAIKTLRDMPTEDLRGAAYGGKAEAIAETAKAREATNQQTLKFLEKIYDGLKPTPSDNRIEVLNNIDLVGLASQMDDGEQIVELVKTLIR